jgi:hypothetical protein
MTGDRQEAFAVQVECTEDEQGRKIPLRFHLGARTVEVIEVIDRWPAAGYCYCKLRGDDGGVYILRQDHSPPRWSITLYAHPDERAASLTA